MSYPLAILGTGMVSALSDSAAGNAALMRCHYNNHLPTHFYDADSGEPYLGSYAHLNKNDAKKLGLDRLVALSTTAIRDVLSTQNIQINDTPLLVNFPQSNELSLVSTATIEQTFMDQLATQLNETVFSSNSVFFQEGSTGFVSALQKAQEYIKQEKAEQVLLLMVDSLLNHHRIAHYENWHDDLPRLLTDDNPNGFIPGEAAVAVLVGKPDPGQPQTLILGSGTAEEEATIGSGKVLKAQGLSQAIRNAAEDAAIRVCDTEFRISNTNGEEYWFREASLAQSRALEQKRSSHPLWHPADSIGEVGAAAGGAMVVMAYYAFNNSYALGSCALCHLSGDSTERAAFIVKSTREEFTTQ